MVVFDGLAQIRGDDLGTGHHLGRRAFGQYFTLIKDNHPVAQGHYSPHDVFYKHNGGPLGTDALYQQNGVINFRRCQA